jgi:enoyl-CoA hydratase
MPPVTYESRDNVAVLRMDDGKANALSYEMMDSLDEALTRAEKEAGAVVLTGRPGKFCAGFDLKLMMAGPDQARALVSRGAELLLRLYALPIPLVIASTGHALAGGALVVLTGDLRLSARGPFRIGLNEVQIGMPVPILAMELARDRLDPKHLIASTLFATIVDPEAAIAAGWIDELADDASLLDTAVARAKKLAELPRGAFGKTKQALREQTIDYVRSTLDKDMQRLVPPAT